MKPGFDAFVGNPPFMGGTHISGSCGERFKDWIYNQFPESGDRMDLVAYFFRRCFSHLSDGGCFGLIATNTIRQGDTRYGGLRWLCETGGTIYSARRRVRWPGQAAVVVSVCTYQKIMSLSDTFRRKSRFQIFSSLFHTGGDGDPKHLFSTKAEAPKEVIFTEWVSLLMTRTRKELPRLFLHYWSFANSVSTASK